MSLADMIAKQKAKQQENQNASSGINAGVSTGASGVVESSGTGHDVAEQAPARLKFGVKKLVATGGSSELSSPTSEASHQHSEPPQLSESVSQVADGVMTLDDLESSEDQGINTPSGSEGLSGFSDEIPATAPDRELPADLTSQQQAFVVQLDSIYEIVHDPELFGGMIRNIMQELQECPDYMKLVADQDVHTMIRGLRSSMGLAKIKKAEKSTKARGSRKAPATTQMLTTADELFNSEDW